MRVLAVPRSIARSLENQPKIEFRTTISPLACPIQTWMPVPSPGPNTTQDAAQMLNNSTAETFGSVRLPLRDKPVNTHKRTQNFRNNDASIGLLEVFDDREPGAANRQSRTV